ncbi:Serine/arginine-rich SC35-like splicing factor SCL30 [Zea mays]|uniref:Serine/arginine-rich SC35-like splicing factor SCL30 n=1 Tax=Zea mays TaxID=4577 RepID=A0A1D6KE47_MAIZE|nr:Serine/arginine-rich SC35-like splicing factor SCL30 [Zea mays]
MPGKGRSAYILSYQGTGARHGPSPITYRSLPRPSIVRRERCAPRLPLPRLASRTAAPHPPAHRPQPTPFSRSLPGGGGCGSPAITVRTRFKLDRLPILIWNCNLITGLERPYLCFVYFGKTMRRYSPPYRSPPRRGYGGRGRSPPPPRRGYGGRKEGSGSLLVRNIPLSVREPRGFAFVEFVDPYDASEAQYHMNRQVFFGREIAVVLAAESRKRPEEMRSRTRVRGYSGRSRSRSPRYRGRPRSRSYSPAPRRGNDYSASPRRQEAHRSSPPRRLPKEHDEDKKRRSYSPASRDDADNVYEKRSPPADSDGSPLHRRSPKEYSGSPPGSRSRSADDSPVASD